MTDVFGFAPWLMIGDAFHIRLTYHVHGFPFDLDPNEVRDVVDAARTLEGLRFQLGALVEEDRAMARSMGCVSLFPFARAAVG
jgi:hypothetical protein